MLNFLGMILICAREMMVPENGGMSAKKGKNLYGIIFLLQFLFLVIFIFHLEILNCHLFQKVVLFSYITPTEKLGYTLYFLYFVCL
jgi:hypothetical protein